LQSENSTPAGSKPPVTPKAKAKRHDTSSGGLMVVEGPDIEAALQ
jgi:hypothetical protein